MNEATAPSPIPSTKSSAEVPPFMPPGFNNVAPYILVRLLPTCTSTFPIPTLAMPRR
jgi:hypothetical protein